MREMKDSGVPWIGEIPKNWEVAPLWRTLRRRTEIGHPEEVVLSLYRDIGIVPKDSRDDNYNVTSLDTSSYKFVRVGDFVINKMKAWQGSMAVSAYQGIVSPAYHVCEFIRDSVSPKYLHYLLRNPSYLPEYGRLSSGLRVGQWDLSYDDFKIIPHIIPSLEEQQRIIDFLDAKCAEIDSILEKTRASIEDYKRLKQSVITEAVTKGIRDDRPMKDSGMEWIGEIPAEWEMSTLGRVSNSVRNGYVGPTRDLFVEEGIRYIQSLHIKEGIIDFYRQEYYVPEDWASKRPKIKTNNLLIVQTGDIGQVALVKEEYNDCNCHALIIVDLNENLVIPLYLSYYLRSHVGKELLLQTKTGALLPHLNSGRVVFTEIILPSVAEQQEITSYLDDKCAAINSLIASKEALIAELEAYKKSIIYEYVTGKREVD
jgi:type I restriction enzyme S subunit